MSFRYSKNVTIVLLLITLIVGTIIFNSVLAAEGKSAKTLPRAPSCRQSPHFSTTLMQPWQGEYWTPSQWDREFDDMKAVCINQVILQYTVIANGTTKGTIYYPTDLPGYTKSSERVDVVGNLLAAALRKGVDVYLGIKMDEHWQLHADDPAWLEAQAREAMDLVKELRDKYRLLSDYKDLFKGWYIAFELDNTLRGPWDRPAQWGNAHTYFSTVGNYAHSITPDKQVVIAPFYNINPPGAAAPTQGDELRRAASDWALLLATIMRGDHIDVVAPQDGTGPTENDSKFSHATLEQLPVMFEATKKAIELANPNIKLWVTNEAFVLNPRAKINLEPMGIASLVADMRAVQPYVTNHVTFSFPKYLDRQHELYYTAYKTYLETGRVETTPPSAPPNLRAVITESFEVKLDWDESTDDAGVAGYLIYRNGEPAAARYRGSPDYATSFLDDSGGPRDAYKVKAFDAAGNLSTSSDITIPRDSPPSRSSVDIDSSSLKEVSRGKRGIPAQGPWVVSHGSAK